MKHLSILIFVILIFSSPKICLFGKEHPPSVEINIDSGKTKLSDDSVIDYSKKDPYNGFLTIEVFQINKYDNAYNLNNYYLNGKIWTKTKLVELLKNIYKSSKDSWILIACDKDVDKKKILFIVDACKKIGYKKIKKIKTINTDKRKL